MKTKICIFILSIPLLFACSGKQKYNKSASENDYIESDTTIFDFEHLTSVDDGINDTTKLISDLTDSYNAYRLYHDMWSCYEDRYFGLADFPEKDVKMLPIKDPKIKALAENYKNEMTKLLENVYERDSTEYEKIYNVRESFAEEIFNFTNKYSLIKSDEEYMKLMEEQTKCVKVINYDNFAKNIEKNPLKSMQTLEKKLHHVTNICEETFLRMLFVSNKEHYTKIEYNFEHTSIEHLRILIDKNTYFPNMSQIYRMWRCLVQWKYFAPSRYAEIPQEEYNAMRMKLANTVLKELSQNPNDALVRDAFFSLATSENFTRYFSQCYGNQVVDDMWLLFHPDY